MIKGTHIVRYTILRRITNWLYVKYGSELYYAALQLVLANKIEGYFTCTKHEFDNFGVKEVNYSVTLTHIRNKVSNENNN